VSARSKRNATTALTRRNSAPSDTPTLRSTDRVGNSRGSRNSTCSPWASAARQRRTMGDEISASSASASTVAISSCVVAPPSRSRVMLTASLCPRKPETSPGSAITWRISACGMRSVCRRRVSVTPSASTPTVAVNQFTSSADAMSPNAPPAATPAVSEPRANVATPLTASPITRAQETS
jgi:hypothetical protein